MKYRREDRASSIGIAVVIASAKEKERFGQGDVLNLSVVITQIVQSFKGSCTSVCGQNA